MSAPLRLSAAAATNRSEPELQTTVPLAADLSRKYLTVLFRDTGDIVAEPVFSGSSIFSGYYGHTAGTVLSHELADRKPRGAPRAHTARPKMKALLKTAGFLTHSREPAGYIKPTRPEDTGIGLIAGSAQGFNGLACTSP
ncbi:hypothetical protein ON010_g6516 [Phytophthora cinnamomi]|nr:hypothetical protein ON010_g6516 [Phytophthora cinnamomi]